MKAIISGGGTAGHVNPALAVADCLKKEYNAQVLFIGTEKGIEKKLVPGANYDIQYIEVSGLIRRLTLKNFMVLKQFFSAVSLSKKIIKEFKPDVVIGTGGYVCAPVLMAAHALGIPTLIHEQNVIPGVTVKLAAKIVDKICISFKDTTKYMKPACEKKCVLTGNPIREAMLSVNKEEARKALGLDERPFIVAFGGSLGAKRLNRAVVELLNADNSNQFQFLLGTGQRFYEETCAALTNKNDAFRILPYIDNMDRVMAAADLVIGRSGALTVSELCAMGKPSVLIPSPNVAHDHQTYNAKSVKDAGGALIITDSDLDGKHLIAAINRLTSSPEKLREMATNAKNIGITDGAKRICDVAKELIDNLQ